MISVILLTHNYANFLSDCLDSINKNDTSLIGEIIIINDNSSDNTDEIVSQYNQTSFFIPKNNLNIFKKYKNYK